jgi:hypothetical protein
MAKRITLYDRNHNALGIATVEDRGDCLRGYVDTSKMPAAARWTFERYEKLVNDQVLNMLDVIEHEIAKMGIVSVSEDGLVIELEDVRLLPKAGKVSFREAVQLTYSVCE